MYLLPKYDCWKGFMASRLPRDRNPLDYLWKLEANVFYLSLRASHSLKIIERPLQIFLYSNIGILRRSPSFAAR